MAVCGLRTLLLIVCVLELIITVQRQVFDFMGYMWLSIIVNFVNILLIIFGSFGAVQYITKYLLAYAIWSFMWFTWNIFLICYFMNLGSLNMESGLLSLGTGSVSWWEGNGWGCQPVWGEVDGSDAWRPARVEGCLLQWNHVELGQSAIAAILALIALPLAGVSAYRSFKRRKPTSDKSTLPRRPIYTIELSTAETNINESSLKPMTPRRVKRRSVSRSAGSSVRRSRRSYRNAGYLASNASLSRDNREAAASRPASAHSSYSNFHGTRPLSYAADREVYEPPPAVETVPITTNRYDSAGRRSNASAGYDVVGPYIDNRYDTSIATYDKMSREYDGVTSKYESRVDMQCESPPYCGGGGAPPPPAPPYSAQATPQAPGPPAYQTDNDSYHNYPYN